MNPQQMNMWNSFQQMLLQQQQQQMMLQNQYMLYQQFCMQNGLDPNNQNSFMLFYQNYMQANNPNFVPQSQFQQQQFQQQQFQQQQFQSQQQVPQGNDIYCQNLTPLLPRDNTILYSNKSQFNNPNMFNITFRASTGYTVVMTVAPNITLNQMFKQYLDKVGVNYNHLGNGILFLFNGLRLDPFSNKIVSAVFKNYANITVFDQAGVIGAFN